MMAFQGNASEFTSAPEWVHRRPRRVYGSEMAAAKPAPTLTLEKTLWAAGNDVVVGVDEVGRGSWAGPLSVGAAVLPPDRRVNGVRDSKQLSEARREVLFDRVAGWCRAWSVGHASHRECDELGMSAAQKLAAARAIDGLGISPDVVLVDGNWDFIGTGNTRTVIKGDTKVLSIAAASILAKVTRDRIMRAEAENYPAFDFDRNKGYPCPRHQFALKGYGPTPIHRRSWAFMDSLPWAGLRLPPFNARYEHSKPIEAVLEFES